MIIFSATPLSLTKKSSCVKKSEFPNASCKAFKMDVFPTLLRPVRTVEFSKDTEMSFNPLNPEILISDNLIEGIAYSFMILY